LIIMASTKNAFGASMVATWRLEWEEVKQIIALGLPAMLSMLLDYLGMLVLLGLLGRLGSADLAAGRVAQSLRSLLFFWTASLGSSCQILLGRAWGSGSLDSVRILRKRYQPFITGCVALMGLPFVFAPGLLAMPYSPVEQVRNAAAGGILMVGFTAPLMGFAYTNVATLRALGKTKLDMYANILPVWLLQLPVAWFFGLHLGWGVQGVFMGAIAYWLGRSVVTQFFVQPYLSGECAKEVQRDRQPKDTDRSGQRQP
jgi:MATE family multidrug resistance protein